MDAVWELTGMTLLCYWRYCKTDNKMPAIAVSKCANGLDN